MAPLPAPGAEVWIAGLPGGSLPTVVIGLDGDVLRVDVPRLGGRHVPVKAGQEAVLLYRDREVPCMARVRALADAGGGEVPMLPVAAPERIQRRQAVRVAVCLDVVLLVPSETDAEVPMGGHLGDPYTVRATTENLSRTGVLLALDAPPRAGGRLRVRLIGLDGAPVELAARVVRSSPAPRGGVGHCALCFEDAGRRERRLLTEFVMDRQRTLRRRELGLD
ncbi:MAG: PilZ domain-containing protein [Thermoleophilia bacterium]|nr:PilZ domain-containing protein [Thermoleophilia bacterium]